MAIRLTVTGDETATLSAEGSAPIGLTAEPSILIDTTEVYAGSHEWTPNGSEQVIEIANKKALDNIRINPIPNNYGLITWDGSTLTVS